MAKYEPGTCNINQKESRKRYSMGGLFLATGLIFSLAYTWLSSPVYIMVFVFIAFTTGFMGFLQGRRSFCVKHAKKETKKTGEREEEIEDEDQVKRDNRTANKIIIESVLLGAIASGAVILANIYLI